MKILIVGKTDPKATKLVKDIYERLSKHDVMLDAYTANKLNMKNGIKVEQFQGDVVITIGGDGTFLWAASNTEVPILPVKMAGKAFLTTETFDDVMKNLKVLEDGKYKIIERPRLEVKGIDCPLAVNEVLVSRELPSKIMDIDFTIEDTTFHFQGDGIMFATSYGSTAYSASAGGSVIEPGLTSISIVPINSFYSKLKPMIIPPEREVKIKLNNNGVLIIDGSGVASVKKGEEFIVKFGKPIKVINITKQKFYERFKNDLIGE